MHYIGSIVVSSSRNIALSIAQEISQGNKAAFEVFYRMERNNLVHFISSYVRDVKLAEDIAQDTFLKVWENHSIIDIQRNIRAYTFTIARNKTLDYLKTYRPSVSLSECACLADSSLDGLVESLDLEKLVQKTYLSLSPKVRNTFIRSRHDGLRNKDIAIEEGITEKTVEYRISTALKIFKKIVK